MLEVEGIQDPETQEQALSSSEGKDDPPLCVSLDGR